MATVMLMHWREATPDQYDQARAKVGWDRDVPEGAKLHVSAFGAFMEHRRSMPATPHHAVS